MTSTAQKITAGSREEWLSARGRRIGGSTISAIMGYDKYRTPYQVWNDLTGRSAEHTENKFTIAGHRLEPVVTEYFSDETEYKIFEWSEENMLYVHPKYDFIVASPDRMYTNENGEICILECKTTQLSVEDIPIKWYCQLQWYLMICGLNEGSIAWLSRGVDFGYRTFYANTMFQKELLKTAVDFWYNNVMTDTPPALISSSDIESYYQDTEDNVVEADDTLVDLHNQLRNVKEQKKSIEAKEDELSELVKLRMMGSETVSYFGKKLFTWKQSARSSFDNKRLKSEKPDIWSAYAKETFSRTFLVKDA